jgi:hypothetical protein
MVAILIQIFWTFIIFFTMPAVFIYLSIFFSYLATSMADQLPMKVIVDVDAGVDDAMALLLLLAADKQKDIEILGITCCHGNTSVYNVCINVLRLLEAAGRSDVSC